MALKKHDFIELDYTGKIKETNEVFDTTNEDIAKKNNIYNSKKTYKPIIICLGESQVIPGLDKKLIGKDIGKHKIELKAEEAFGKKDAKLFQLIPLSTFKKQGIEPTPGLVVNIDGIIGIVKTKGSRVIVDFNHPLAGKDLVYEVEIKRIVKNDKEKLQAYLNLLGIDYEIKEKDKKLIVKTKTKLQEQVKEKIDKKLKEIFKNSVILET